MKRGTRLGSRITEVHNGGSHVIRSTRQGLRNNRSWIIENGWPEVRVAVPRNTFYNCGSAKYVSVLTNRKPEHSRDKVQQIDATEWFRPPRMSLETTNGALGPEDIQPICRTFLEFE